VHLGVETGLPCFGVGKTPFMFAYEAPGDRRGDESALLDGDAVVGSALRTQPGVKPVFVSVGHRIGLDNARAHTLHLARKYRLPETTRQADPLSRRALKQHSLRRP
jgi:deoxyribonuclease V